MSDAKDGILDIIKFRLNNSFLSSVIISWPFVNYKLLMVVFGGGNYEKKIDYINDRLYEGSYKWLFFVVIPLVIGGLYIFIFPFFNSWFELLDRWFKNRHREALFKKDAVETISAVEKEAYFSYLEGTNQSIKDELRSARNSEISQVTAVRVQLEGVKKRFYSTVLKQICKQVMSDNIDAEILGQLVKSYPSTAQSLSPDLVRKFVDSDIFEKSLKLATSLVNMNYITPTRKVTLTLEVIEAESGVSHDKITEFIDYFLAFEIIEETDFPNNKFITKDKVAQEEKKNLFNEIKIYRSQI